MTMIQMCEVVFGKYLGKLLSFLLISYFLVSIAGAAHGFTDFIKSHILFQTPQLAIIISLTLLAGWAAGHGVETIARCAEILVPLLFCIELITELMLIPEMHLEYTTPMFQTPPANLAWEACRISTFPFGLLIAFGLMLPFSNNLKRIHRVFVGGAATGALFTILLTFRNIIVLGDTLAIAEYPSYSVVEQINIGNVFTRLEVLVSSNFITLGFIAVAVTFYTVMLSIGQLCRLRTLKPLVLPLALAIALLALVHSENNAQQARYLASVYPLVAFPFQYILPIMLLVFSYVLPWARRKAATGERTSTRS